MPGRFVEKDRVGRARGAVSPEFSAKRPLPDPRALLANWWKGRDSNPRPRHYELAAPLKISFKFNNLPRDAPLRLARRSTTEQDRFPQNSRNSRDVSQARTPTPGDCEEIAIIPLFGRRQSGTRSPRRRGLRRSRTHAYRTCRLAHPPAPPR